MPGNTCVCKHAYMRGYVCACEVTSPELTSHLGLHLLPSPSPHRCPPVGTRALRPPPSAVGGEGPECVLLPGAWLLTLNDQGPLSGPIATTLSPT